jgi:hypothetical protein
MRAGTEYVFGVRITNVSYSRLLPQRFRARLPWIARLHWLSDPRIYAPETDAYRLDSGRKFSCYEVLNHRVREHGGLNPGDSIEGVLLAFARNRIPMELLHRTIAPAQLSVEDQFGREHDSEIEILIDRRATMRPPVFRPCGKGLFDDTEPRAGTNLSEEMQLPAEILPNTRHVRIVR